MEELMRGMGLILTGSRQCIEKASFSLALGLLSAGLMLVITQALALPQSATMLLVTGAFSLGAVLGRRLDLRANQVWRARRRRSRPSSPTNSHSSAKARSPRRRR